MCFTGLGGGSRPLGEHQRTGLSKFFNSSGQLNASRFKRRFPRQRRLLLSVAPLEYRRCRAGFQAQPRQFLPNH